MGFSNKKGPFSEINMTPLVDVMLVLLVIFMITAPLMFNGIELNLPKTREVNPINLRQEQVVLSLTEGHDLFVGKLKVEDGKLIDVLNYEFKRTKSKILFLRADFKVEYGKVAKLMSFLKAKGFSDIALVTEIEQGKK